MEEIEITIKIPKHEYENWSDFVDSNKEEMLNNLKVDMRESLQRLYIKSYQIEVKINK